MFVTIKVIFGDWRIERQAKKKRLPKPEAREVSY
jgi:hypothetical protein